jgi:hypothetical protein
LGNKKSACTHNLLQYFLHCFYVWHNRLDSSTILILLIIDATSNKFQVSFGLPLHMRLLFSLALAISMDFPRNLIFISTENVMTFHLVLTLMLPQPLRIIYVCLSDDVNMPTVLKDVIGSAVDVFLFFSWYLITVSPWTYTSFCIERN